MSNKDKIPVFSDLKDPVLWNYSSYAEKELKTGLSEEEVSLHGAKNYLDKVIQEGYETFLPRNIAIRFLNNMSCPSDEGTDSSYGVRIQLTQEIIALAMYSTEGFVKYLKKKSNDLKQEAAETIKDYNSPKSRFSRKLRSIPKKLRYKMKGKEQPKEIIIEKEWEVVNRRVSSKICLEMADVVSQIGEEFSEKSFDEIFRLAEIDHIFSGAFNGTDKNITFTNERLREYGAKLQQFISRIWDAGVAEDKPDPLSENQLFPIIRGEDDYF